MAHVAAPPTAVHHVWLRTTSRTDKVQSTKQEISTIIFQKIGYLVLSTTVPYARYCKHTTVCGGSLFIFFPVLSFSHFTFLQVDRRLGGNGRFLSTTSTVVASERYHTPGTVACVLLFHWWRNIPDSARPFLLSD